jgi:L-amino acid N-acyltransferase YncA
MEIRIGPMAAEDWPACRQIYEEGIATGQATFETVAPDWAAWDAAHLAAGRMVARDAEDRVIGWAALSPVSDRCAYEGVAEASIYVAASARRQGVGGALMRALLDAADASGVWTVQAGVLVENRASLALAERTGFRTIGIRERIGRLDGTWRDVMLLERRSSVVGVD